MTTNSASSERRYYRAQGDRVIRASSYAELIERMKARIASELPRPAAAGARDAEAVLTTQGVYIQAR